MSGVGRACGYLFFISFLCILLYFLRFCRIFVSMFFVWIQFLVCVFFMWWWRRRRKRNNNFIINLLCFFFLIHLIICFCIFSSLNLIIRNIKLQVVVAPVCAHCVGLRGGGRALQKRKQNSVFMFFHCFLHFRYMFAFYYFIF